jgi:HSP20 family molecular chaperone IbpA
MNTEFPFVTVGPLPGNGRNFPPFNLVERANTVVLEMAVAGYTRDRLTVEYQDGSLIVRGSAFVTDERYHRRGIANSAFVRTFDLAKNALVKDVTLLDGILKVTVATEQPLDVVTTTFEIS